MRKVRRAAVAFGGGGDGHKPDAVPALVRSSAVISRTSGMSAKLYPKERTRS